MKPRRQAFLIWAALIAITAGIAWRYVLSRAHSFLNLDQSVYTYTGWAWGQGYWPYVSTWDHKGPVIYAVTMLRTMLLDASPASTAVEMLVLGCITAALVALLANRLWGSNSAAVAFSLWILLWAGAGSHSEFFHQTPVTLVALFSTASFLASVVARRSEHISRAALLATTVGVFGGLAFFTKPTALPGYVIALLMIAWPMAGRSLNQRILLFGAGLAGALLPIGILTFVFFRAGALNALLDCYFAFNAQKGGHILGGLGLPRLAWTSLKSIYAVGLGVPLAIVAAAAIVLPMNYGRTPISRQWQQIVVSPYVILVFLWLLLEVCVVALSGGQRYHTLAILPPCVLAGTWLIQWSYRNTARRRNILSLVILAGFFVPAAIRIASSDAGRYLPKARSDAWNRIVTDIKRNTGPDDTIYAPSTWGAFLLNETHRRSASRYLNEIPLMTRGYATDARWVELLQELQAHPPRIIFSDLEGMESTPDLKRMLDWMWHPRFFRVPPDEIDSTLYPGRDRFIAYVAQHYRLDYCVDGHCLLKLRDA